MKKYLLVLFVFAAVSVNRTAANILVNGGFESPVLTNDQVMTSIPGWVIATGNIDLVHGQGWVSSEGSQSIDLEGSTIGSIYQIFTTAVGQEYSFSFNYSDNPYVGDDSARVRIIDGNTEANLVDFTVYGPTGNSPTAMMWQSTNGTFIATSTSTLIRFDSWNVNNYSSAGTALDNVQVDAIPEPASMMLVLSVLGLLSIKRLFFSRV